MGLILVLIVLKNKHQLTWTQMKSVSVKYIAGVDFVLIRLDISCKKNGFAAVLLFIDESPKEGFSSPGSVQPVRPNSLIQLRSEYALPRFIIHRLLSDGKARRVRLCDVTKQNNVILVLRFVVLKKASSQHVTLLSYFDVQLILLVTRSFGILKTTNVRADLRSCKVYLYV